MNQEPCTDDTDGLPGESEDLVLEQLAGKKMPWRRYRAKVRDWVCPHQHRNIERAFECLAIMLRLELSPDTCIGWDWIRENGVSAATTKMTIEIAVVDERGNPVTYESVRHLQGDRLF